MSISHARFGFSIAMFEQSHFVSFLDPAAVVTDAPINKINVK